jgi:Lipopolysaccharide-assembly
MKALATGLATGLLFICLLTCSCSHYSLGTQGKLNFTSVYIEPVGNKSSLRQAQEIISEQLRSALEKDGRVTLVNSPQAADVTLTVTLSNFRRDVSAVRETDTGLASKFTLTLESVCALSDNRTHTVLFQNRHVSVEASSFTDKGIPAITGPGNQQQSEYNTVPILAQELADKVSHVVLDVW